MTPEQAQGSMEHLATVVAGVVVDGMTAAMQQGVQPLRVDTQGEGQGRLDDKRWFQAADQASIIFVRYTKADFINWKFRFESCLEKIHTEFQEMMS